MEGDQLPADLRDAQPDQDPAPGAGLEDHPGGQPGLGRTYGRGTGRLGGLHLSGQADGPDPGQGEPLDRV